MYYQNQYYYYLQSMNNYIEKQNERIKEMEGLIKELQDEISQLKEKPVTNIEKIEYNFDQLKIETLEGTLNIGLTPNSPNNIEEFAVNQSTQVPHVLQKYPDMYPVLQDQVYRFLDQDCPQLIQSLSQKDNRQLEQSHYQFIIDDVKKQVGERIYYYLNQYKEKDLNHLSREQIVKEAYYRIQHDIEHAIESFVKNMPQGGTFNQ